MAAPEVYSVFKAVTPSDTVDLPFGPCDALWIGGAGNLAVLTLDGKTQVGFSGVLAGTVLPISARRVYSASTTATLIVALYDR